MEEELAEDEASAPAIEFVPQHSDVEVDPQALEEESERVRRAAAETLCAATADGSFEAALQAMAAERGAEEADDATMGGEAMGEDAAVTYRDRSEPRIYSHIKSNPWRPSEPVGPPPDCQKARPRRQGSRLPRPMKIQSQLPRSLTIWRLFGTLLDELDRASHASSSFPSVVSGVASMSLSPRSHTSGELAQDGRGTATRADSRRWSGGGSMAEHGC